MKDIYNTYYSYQADYNPNSNDDPLSPLNQKLILTSFLAISCCNLRSTFRAKCAFL